MLLGVVVGGLKSGERGLVAVAQRGVMLLAQAGEVSARRGRHLGRLGGGLGGDVGDLCGDLPGGAGGLDENAGIVVDKNRFQREAQVAGMRTIDELNSALLAWMELEYNTRVHSATGQSPDARFRDGLPTDQHRITDLDSFNALFLWRARRTVKRYTVRSEMRAMLAPSLVSAASSLRNCGTLLVGTSSISSSSLARSAASCTRGEVGRGRYGCLLSPGERPARPATSCPRAVGT